jgi:hypothetical protein
MTAMVVVVDMCTVYVDTGMLCSCIVVYGMYMAVYGNVSNVCCLIILFIQPPPSDLEHKSVAWYIT